VKGGGGVPDYEVDGDEKGAKDDGEGAADDGEHDILLEEEAIPRPGSTCVVDIAW